MNDPRPMRVLFCQTCAYLPADGGGALSNTDELCSALPARGVDVAVLSGLARRSWSRLRSVIGRRRGAPDRSLGYPVYRVEDPLAFAGHLADEQRPDVAVVQLGDITGLAHRFVDAGIPTLIYFHDPYSMPEPWTLPTHPLLGFAACSSALALQVARRLGVEVATAPVMIQPARYRTDSERRVVTFVNPIPRKGVEIAFALAARRPDIPFEFVESSQLRGRVVKLLQARAAHHGNVRLLRRRADMRSIYRRSRVLLAPSLWDEAWGRVVTEAQVSGIPALASDSGGLPEAVGPGGLIVERSAAEERWHQALSRLWDDQEAYERYAAAAAAHAGRPEIQPEAALGRMMELIARQSAVRGTPAS